MLIRVSGDTRRAQIEAAPVVGWDVEVEGGAQVSASAGSTSSHRRRGRGRGGGPSASRFRLPRSRARCRHRRVLADPVKSERGSSSYIRCRRAHATASERRIAPTRPRSTGSARAKETGAAAGRLERTWVMTPSGPSEPRALRQLRSDRVPRTVRSLSLAAREHELHRQQQISTCVARGGTTRTRAAT